MPQAVEEKYRQRQRRLHGRHIERAPEPTHRDLKRVRSAVGLQSDRFAVEDQLRRLDRTQRVDDLGRRGRHVVAIAREDAHLVGRLVYLHPRSVELPLERCAAEHAESLGDVVRGLREHRRDRLHQLEGESPQCARALRQSGMRDGGDAAGDHGGLSHRGSR